MCRTRSLVFVLLTPSQPMSIAYPCRLQLPWRKRLRPETVLWSSYCIRRPLVNATRPPRSSFISSLIYSPPLKFQLFCLLARLSEQNLSPQKKRPRTQQKRKHPYQGITPFQRHPHVIVWLVSSRAFIETLTPVHGPTFLRRTFREFFHYPCL